MSTSMGITLVIHIAAGAVGWGYARAELLRSRAPTVLFGGMEEIVALLAGRGSPITEGQGAEV